MDDNQWELSKENIQPIRQGRAMSFMMAGLDENAQQHLNRQRNEFETELRSYSGSDPLDVWHRYALWVEQSYPTGGKASKLQPLLEKCFTAINTSTELTDKYRNDPRFLQLWLKYASMYKKPLEVLHVLEVKGLCTELAGFYENYASEMEASGNFKKADLIYKKGLEKAKDSKLMLSEAHKSFQARVFLASMAKKDDDSDDEGVQGRVAFSALKVGKKNQAPVERVEGAVLGGAGKVSLASTVKTSGNVAAASRHSIYKDEQATGRPTTSMGPPTTLRAPKLPSASVDEKENERTATKWSKKTVSAAVINIPLDQISKFSNTAATIYHDENVVQPPRHFIPPNNNVLKEWKNPSEKEAVLPFIPEAFNPFSRPYYDKHRVYQGTEEFQFEELRAIDYFKKENLRKEAEEKATVQGHVSQLKAKDAEIDSIKEVLSQQQKILEQLMLLQQPKDAGQSDAPEQLPNSSVQSQHSGADKETVEPCERTSSSSENIEPSQPSFPQSGNIKQCQYSGAAAGGVHQSVQRDPRVVDGGSLQCVDAAPMHVTSAVNQLAKSCVFEDSWLAINKTANASVLCPVADTSLLPLQVLVLPCPSFCRPLDSSMAPRTAQPHSSTAYKTLPDLQLPTAADVTGVPDISELSLMEPIVSPGQLPVPTITYTEASPEQEGSSHAVPQHQNTKAIPPPESSKDLSSFPKPAVPVQQTAVKPKIIASDGYRKPESQLQNIIASPTVNTKEAQRLMREVWSTSLDRSKQELSVLQHVLEDTSDSVLVPPPAPIFADMGLAVDQIYRDEPEPPVEKPAVLSVYHDEPSAAVASKKAKEGLALRPAGLSERPAGLSERPAGLSERPAGLSERPAGLSERPAGLSERPAGLSERPAGLSERPAGLSERPAGLSERPAGLSERPAGLSERPAGLSVLGLQTSAETSSPDMVVQDENVPPAGYVQIPMERPRVGVLMPVPCADQVLPHQEDDDDDDCMDLEDIKPLPPPSPPFCGPPTDVTMKLPSNLADFADHTHVASTPAAWSSRLVPQAGVDGDDFTMAFMPGYKRSFRPMPVVAKKEDQRLASAATEAPATGAPATEAPTAEAPTAPKSGAHLPNLQGTPVVKGQLSVIMEGSAEHTSVRSATSCSTLTTTRASHHSGTGTMCHTTFDHTKSGYLTDGSVSCVSRATTSGAAATACAAPTAATTTDAPSKLPNMTQDMKENNGATSKESGSADAVVPEGWRNTSFDPDKLSDMLLNMSDSKPFFSVAATHKDTASSTDGALAASAHAELPAAFTALGMAGELDPFSEDLLSALLQGLAVPLHERAGFSTIDTKMPLIKAQTTVTLASDQFHVRRVKGQGAYAKIFQASAVDPMNVTALPDDNELDVDDNDDMILKVQKPSFPWEFYICHELRERLRKAGRPPHVLESVMRINRGYFFNNGSVLATQYHKHGTLLDLLNKYKIKGLSVAEGIVIYFMIEILLILENVHSVGIIHADIKPDNFILTNVPALDFSATSCEEMFVNCPSSLKLIDFGRSIDLQLLPEGTTFTRKVTTEGFTCCEMKDGRPWTYQGDLYGAAATAHTLLWGSYMNVCKKDGRWGLQGVHFKRYWQQDMWCQFFDTLLNVASCSEMPDLAQIRRSLQKAFFEDENSSLQLHMTQLRSIMSQS
ncbi:Protein kinase domain [Trinorchestia longiramus]|nr:Protein kinase domain [Trinorchestia longiramus]